MNPTKDDDLTLLWRQGTSAEPDPEEIARLAGRASMRRFDRMISRRNFREYLAGLVLIVFFGGLIVTGADRSLGLIGFVCVAFFVGYLRWQHRHLTPLDPTADARAYQAAMLARIDKQIRLLSTVRYWGVLPLYLPGLWMTLQAIRVHSTTRAETILRIAAVVGLILQTGLFVWIVWLNERSRWGIPWLRAKRAQIERIYEE